VKARLLLIDNYDSFTYNLVQAFLVLGAEDMIRAFAGRIPVLGVCLGHQSIVEVFGGHVVRAGRLMHGKTSLVQHDGCELFAGLPRPCEVGRYHSLIAEPASLPGELEVSAHTEEGEIMGVRHRTLMVEGVQFHPESILTPEGPKLLGNFLRMAGGRRAAGGG
jgi:anthranilate synthase/aminodeoxychorismate synthase-like glutamine amidotransferase